MTAGVAHVLVRPLCYAAALSVAKGVSLLMVPAVTSVLPPADYASIETLASVADIGGVLLGLGLADALFRFAGAGGEDGRRVEADVLGLALACAGLFLVVGQAAAPLLAAAMPAGIGEWPVRLLLVSLALTATIEAPFAWLRMVDRAGLFLMFVAGRAVVQAGLVLVALHQGWGVPGVIGATAASDVALSIALVATLAGRMGIRLSPQAAVRLLRYGVPLTIGGVAAFALGSCDRWFLAGRAQELAHYALAGKFALATALLLQPFDLWWYPRRLAVLAGPDGVARTARTVGVGLSLVVLSASVAALGGPFAIVWLTPAAYHGAVAYVPWLALAAALHAVASLVNAGCYLGRTGVRPMAVNGAAAVLALAGYVLFIPGWGVAGAIAATLFAQTARIGLFLHLGQRAAFVPYPLWRAGLLATLAAGLVGTVRGLGTGPAGMAAAGAVLLVLLLTAYALRLLPVGALSVRPAAAVTR